MRMIGRWRNDAAARKSGLQSVEYRVTRRCCYKYSTFMQQLQCSACIAVSVLYREPKLLKAHRDVAMAN
jgi:hypothetical protein